MKGTPFLNGEMAYRFLLTKQVDRVGEADRMGDIHIEVLTLKAFGEPTLARDKEFQREWVRLNGQEARDEEHVSLPHRLEELGLIMKSLYRNGILGKKGVPHDATGILDAPSDPAPAAEEEAGAVGLDGEDESDEDGADGGLLLEA